jgi:hypothetical protein
MAVSAGLTTTEMGAMTIEELEAWAKAGENLAKRRAGMLYLTIAAAMHGGKACEEFNRRMRLDK